MDDQPWIVRALFMVFVYITWPLVRPIFAFSPGLPRVAAAVFYYGWIVALLIFFIRGGHW
jgi:hypothetical protein